MPKKLTTEEFITKARAIHDDKYDYSKVVYRNFRSPVTIICPIHGEFKQAPHNHIILKQGCAGCAGVAKKDVNTFIEEAKKLHGDHYDYSRVEYKNANTKVKIVCPEHGVFEQTPHNHLHNKGCPECAGCKKLTKEKFIRKAREVFGDKYDYSLVEYVDWKTKVKIICPEHGVFEQTPNNHTSHGSGCPHCSEWSIPDNVYLLVDSDYKPTRMKIGITNNIKVRLQKLRRGNKHSGLQPTPFKIFKKACYKVGEGKAYEIEQMFHRYYASRNLGYTGFDGATEWFEYDPQAEKLLAEIAANMKVSA